MSDKESTIAIATVRRAITIGQLRIYAKNIKKLILCIRKIDVKRGD